MNKILIEVYVPTIEETYDIFVPSNKKIKTIIILIIKTVNELSNGVYPLKKDATLINRTTGKTYSYETSVKLSGLKNGSRVILT